ncbi:DUF485 domain-containing protein [Virgibacillus oceani]|uniref:Membrane protein n=1 Tax=Virgibacillus oceani TaxID=1479511 RepID=A0A917H465_9BACI|nr:DUF485 domain-containing protein [Virgibacillus oceani]GGG66998.1 membrane protein [Virgibacillus oceani]
MGSLNELESSSRNREEPDFEKVADGAQFKELVQERKKFIVPMTVFFLVFYFSLPVLTSYTTILNTPAIGDISWAWIFALAQFIMTWVLCTVYVKKSASFDKKADQVIESLLKEGGK